MQRSAGAGWSAWIACAAVLCLGWDLASAADPGAIQLSEPILVRAGGARNPTVATDPASGRAYIAWAEAVAPKAAGAKHRDPVLQAMVARSDDAGHGFSGVTRVSIAQDHVTSAPVSAPRVRVGPKGAVYVLYTYEDPGYRLLGMRVRDQARLRRSDDGALHFADPVNVGTEALEGVATSTGMINLLAAADGMLYVSWLDPRDTFAYVREHGKWPPLGEHSSPQLRVAASSDGGHTFGASAVAAKTVCVCCGTQVSQGGSGPIYATTRGVTWPEGTGVGESVRDVVVARSTDRGSSWSEPTKTHDDGFRVNTCPDVNSGLAVDSQLGLHAAWYTGAESHPGIWYARSSDQGAHFSAPIPLLTGDWIPYGGVRLVVDSEDNAWVVLEDHRGDGRQIELVHISRDGVVTRTTPWAGSSPDIAALAKGVLLTWHEDAKSGHAGVYTRLARADSP